ncbi:hypothetical protein [Dysosmobacter sp.]
MKNPVTMYEENGQIKFKLSNRTVNAVARDLASMFPATIPWEVIAKRLRGEGKEDSDAEFTWQLLEFLEDDRFDKYDGMAMNIMLENLLHLDGM